MIPHRRLACMFLSMALVVSRECVDAGGYSTLLGIHKSLGPVVEEEVRGGLLLMVRSTSVFMLAESSQAPAVLSLCSCRALPFLSGDEGSDGVGLQFSSADAGST